jgi:AraC-like DNA-binding protein
MKSEVVASFARPVYVRSVMDCLNSLGVRPSTVLSSAGLAWQDLCEGPHSLDFPSFRRFVSHAIRLSGDPALGLIAGSMIQPYHSPVGIAAVTSPNIGQGLHLLTRYSDLVFGGLEFRLHNGPQWSTLTVRPMFPLWETQVFVAQTIVGAHSRLLEAMLGRFADELVVGLPYPRPDGNDVPCLRYVRRIYFDQEHLSFRLPVELLGTTCASADEKAFSRSLQSCMKMESETGHSTFVQRVRSMLLEGLASNPDVTQLASSLGISTRILVRRLADAGVTYSDLKEELRRSHATWYLQHTELSIEAIATKLGYADPTNFGRKFKHWYRVAPSKMRNALRSDAQ